MSANPLNALRREVLALIEQQHDWLDGLHVALPDGLDAAAWRKQVEQMLFDLSIDSVDVRVDSDSEGPPWIVSSAVKPGWS